MNDKATVLTRIFFILFLTSIALAIINYFVTGGDKTTLTTLVKWCGILMMISWMFFGLDLILRNRKMITGRGGINGFVVLLASTSFLIIFIRGPILKMSLNESVNLACGIIFILMVLVGLVNNLRK